MTNTIKVSFKELMRVDVTGEASVQVGFIGGRETPAMVFTFPNGDIKLVELPWKNVRATPGVDNKPGDLQLEFEW